MIRTLLSSFFVIFLMFYFTSSETNIDILSYQGHWNLCEKFEYHHSSTIDYLRKKSLLTNICKAFFIHQVFLLKKFFKVTYFCLCKIVAMLETLAHMYQAADTFIIGDVSTIKYISIFKARCNFDVSIIFGKFIPPLHSNQQEFGFIFRNDFIFSPSSNIVASCNK